MNWLNPGMLWALFLLGIPIIIHLFYFRRYKKVFFSDIRLLEELKKETNKFSRMRNLLALLMRLLVVAALVFAFARPFFNQDEQILRSSVISIYLDNSMSMSAHSKDVALLDIAKKKAKEIVGAYSEQNRFQVISNEMKASQQNLLDQKRALEYIDDIQIYKGAFELQSIYARQKELIDRAELSAEIYWISDFQKSTTIFEYESSDTVLVNAVLVQDLIERNVSLDTAWFTRPDHLSGRNSELIYQVSNHSNQDANAVSISMEYEGQTRPLGNYDMPGESSFRDTVAIPINATGWKALKLKIKDYPVSFDDELFLAFQVRPSHEVLVINQQVNPYVSNLFPSQKSIKVTQVRPEALNYSEFEKKQLIVLEDLERISSGLEDELYKFIDQGGKLLVFPSALADLNQYNSLLKKLNSGALSQWNEGNFEVSTINNKEALFSGVFKRQNRNMNLPITKARFKILKSSNPNQISLLNFRDGSSYMMKSEMGSGQVFLASAPLSIEYNDLVRNGDIFVPMLYNMSTIQGRASKLYFTLGERDEFICDIENTADESAFSLVRESTSVIPPQRRLGKKLYISTGQDIIEAGIYQLSSVNAQLEPRLAINESRNESNLDCYLANEIEDQFGSKVSVVDVNGESTMASVIQSKDSSNRIWRYLMIAALIFLVVESIILRLKA